MPCLCTSAGVSCLCWHLLSAILNRPKTSVAEEQVTLCRTVRRSQAGKNTKITLQTEKARQTTQVHHPTWSVWNSIRMTSGQLCISAGLRRPLQKYHQRVPNTAKKKKRRNPPVSPISVSKPQQVHSSCRMRAKSSAAHFSACMGSSSLLIALPW